DEGTQQAVFGIGKTLVRRKSAAAGERNAIPQVATILQRVDIRPRCIKTINETVRHILAEIAFHLKAAAGDSFAIQGIAITCVPSRRTGTALETILAGLGLLMIDICVRRLEYRVIHILIVVIELDHLAADVFADIDILEPRRGKRITKE